MQVLSRQELVKRDGGFAVVAEQIRGLAEESAKNAEEIETVVKRAAL